MDERTIESSQRATALFEQQARDNLNATKTYTVIVLGRDGNKPFSIRAANADERQKKLIAAGVDILQDDWAAGYLDGSRREQLCGNNDEAKNLVRQHLRKR